MAELCLVCSANALVAADPNADRALDVSRIIKTQGKIESFGDRLEIEEKVSKLDAVDFIGKQELASVA